MTIRNPRLRGAKLLLAFLLAAGATAFALLGVQQPASAAACTVSAGGTAPQGTCYNVQLAHKCESIGTLPNGNEADICVDIWTSWSTGSGTNGTLELWGTGEYYCQGPSTQCKGINGQNSLRVDAGATALAGANESSTQQSRDYTCSTTSCPAGGRAMVSTTHAQGYATRFPLANACFTATETIPTSNAILVNGTSTAFHPQANFSVKANICYDDGTIFS
ncbi:MAG: hypothetical protein J2P17_25170 [Mycobacterium sp.]|nr:hypothetical protein [Mycobacterium sp.]